VYPVHQAFLVARRWRFARKFHRRHANRAHRDPPDLRVHPANLAHPVQMATLAAQAKMVATDHPVRPDQPEHQAALAKTEKKDQPARPQLASHLHPAMLDLLVKMVPLAHPVKMVLPVPMVDPAQQETKVPRAQRVHRATMALQATKDPRAQMVPKANRVFAPNIAPPTEASSSKMAQGDKRSLRSLRRICYTDEKPVFFMSIFVFAFVLQSSVKTTAAASSPVISFGAFCDFD